MESQKHDSLLSDQPLSDRTDCLASDSGIENLSNISNLSGGSNSCASPRTFNIHDRSHNRDRDEDSRGDHPKRQLSSRISTDSSSTFELVGLSNSPADDESIEHDFHTNREADEAMCRNESCKQSPSGLSLSLPVKPCEVDLHEERDTFSPVNSAGYISDQQQDELMEIVDSTVVEATRRRHSIEFLGPVEIDHAASSLELEDNKTYEKKRLKSTTSSTKEEKQRQNEEIVIMETSSISSETGSWESVFPQHGPNNSEVKHCCQHFIQNERNCCGLDLAASQPIADGLERAGTTNSSAPSVSACFIDASTLLDEPDISFSSLGPNLPEVPCLGPKVVSAKIEPDALNLTRIDGVDEDLSRRAKAQALRSYSNSSSSGESPNKSSSAEENSNNLSDEEKLRKRKSSRKDSSRVDVKDQFVRQRPENYPMFGSLDKTKADVTTSSKAGEEDDRGSRQRREQERLQGTLIFKNSIQQFSGHLISPKMPFPDENMHDFSMGTKDMWREGQQYDSTSSNFGDASECAESSSNFNSNIQSESESSSMPCILPDTPHNSIMQVDVAKHLRDHSDNLHTTLGSNKAAKRITRCDDSAPIVSGGASIKDFTPKQCESPPMRRKTDSCPIVSGGIISLDYEKDNDADSVLVNKREKLKMTPQVMKTWVVDMSDCQSGRRRSTSSSSSTENTARTESSASDHKNGTQGFYVSMKDSHEAAPGGEEYSKQQSSKKLSRSYHDQIRKPTGFYIDLSESENSRTATPPPSVNVNTPPRNGSENSNDKKNIFSMFIDFGEKRSVRKREPLSLASRLSTSLNQKRESDSMKSSCSSIETVMTQSANSHSGLEKFDSTGEAAKTSSDESKKPSYTFTESGSPIMRRTPIRSIAKDDSKRHSWNNPETKSSQPANREHKRSISLTADKGMMNIIDKLPIISKTSSMSIDSSLSPFEDFTCSKSELSTYSNNSNSATSASVHSSGGDDEDPAKKMKKRRKDVHLNETFDKSSQGSLTDGVFSKESSPVSTTDTEDLTFQQEENMCIAAEAAASVATAPMKDSFTRSGLMETIVETKETASPKKQPTSSVQNGDTKSHTMETLHATIEKQKQLLETVTEHVEASSTFVKLSDMDKPISKFELHSPENGMSKSVGSHRHISRLFQETNRSRPHSWNMSRSIGNNIVNITSSVENLKSLSRLFPHLSREISSSLPGDVSFEMFNRSPHDNGEGGQSDYSAESSLASSISRSGMDESSISCRQPRRLGEDLLKMFLQEIGTDVVVEVNGRRIKAHKCILRSRCQYFAAMLAGGWVQSAGNVISLPGYSYSSVHFALCHIYSGASHPPEGISLMELAALADLLGLEGLKEVTAHSLKLNYCHNFHKPCSGCIDGILQVLPVALNHALDDLYRKCLKWTCRYYMKVWPTRPFAQLPSDIYSRCRQLLVAHMTTESVLETILDCDHLISQLAPCRWAANIENLIRDVLDAAYGYLSDHFASLIASDSFLSLGHDKCHNISRLETTLLQTASTLLPDQACRSYQRITRLNAVLAAKVIKVPGMSDHGNEFANGRVAESLHEHEEEEMEWNEEFIRLVSAILSAVEQCLTKQCGRAMRVAAWQRMDLELRKKIQKLACLTEPLDMRRSKNMPKQISFSTSGSRSQDLYQVKLAIQEHSKRALAQDMQLYRATAHTQTNNYDNNKNIQTNEKAVQANNESKEVIGKVFKSSSKSNVLQPAPIILKPKQDKVKALGHRRTLSEDSTKAHKLATDFPVQNVVSTASASRLTEVRPRYLEPRKPRGFPLKSQTSSNIPSLKGKHISSSDSSRTSSPATNIRNARNVVRKIGTKSTNMSLDSLASPSKKAAMNLKLKGRGDMDISVDSLGDSMKSSIKTDKTISQESLVRCDPNNANKISRSHPVINKENIKNTKPATNKFARNKPLSCQTTSGSSPSSVTNKSGRLSSTTSSVNSPRDAFKNRSISVPAGVTHNNNVRKSFLTPKSREILARKSATAAKLVEPNNLHDKLPQTNTVCKSSSSSNIPTRRAQSTTLHQRKSLAARPLSNTVANPTQSSQLKCVQRNSSTHRMGDRRSVSSDKSDKSVNRRSLYDNIKMEKEMGRGEQRYREERIELVIENKSDKKEPRIESKLERSSTFCKETSDLPVSELQIIE